MRGRDREDCVSSLAQAKGSREAIFREKKLGVVAHQLSYSQKGKIGS
jgi:hypothetical protein